MTTAPGHARVRGRLGQAHADVLEALLTSAEQCARLPDARIKLLVDPAKVRRCARQQQGKSLTRLIDDLMTASVEIMAPAHVCCAGHLIDRVVNATRDDGGAVTRGNPLGDPRPLWRVELGAVILHLWAHDLSLNYDPAPIARFRHGVSQAVARLLLTHDPARQPRGGWFGDTLIRQTCGEIAGTLLYDRRRELKADAAAFREIGVILDAPFRFRLQHKRGKAPQKTAVWNKNAMSGANT